ncbi:MAG: TMEM165/GDT1 family protein [Nitrososphaerales archaeon]
MILITFPLIFLGELPDKTMFANLVMATRGKPRQVWLGAAGAFAVHVAIAVSVGVAIFVLLPRTAVDAVVSALFLGGAAYAWWLGGQATGEQAERPVSDRSVMLTSFLVIFLAEWGDLTQILTANLAARYHSPIYVGIGAVLALWSVAALAVVSGQALLRVLDIGTIRKVTAIVLLGLAGYAAWSAAH